MEGVVGCAVGVWGRGTVGVVSVVVVAGGFVWFGYVCVCVCVYVCVFGLWVVCCS